MRLFLLCVAVSALVLCNGQNADMSGNAFGDSFNFGNLGNSDSSSSNTASNPPAFNFGNPPATNTNPSPQPVAFNAGTPSTPNAQNNNQMTFGNQQPQNSFASTNQQQNQQQNQQAQPQPLNTQFGTNNQVNTPFSSNQAQGQGQFQAAQGQMAMPGQPRQQFPQGQQNQMAMQRQQNMVNTGPGGFALGTNQWNQQAQRFGNQQQQLQQQQQFGQGGPANAFMNFGTSGNDGITFQDQGLPTGVVDNLQFGLGPNQQPMQVNLGQFDLNQQQQGINGFQEVQTFPGIGGVQGVQGQAGFMPQFDLLNAGNQLQQPMFTDTMFGLGGPGFSGGIFSPPPQQGNGLFGGGGGGQFGGFGGGAFGGFQEPPRRRSFWQRLFG